MKIIDKYKGTARKNRVFPMITCGLTNRYLKEIARQCGIERRLTFHMSRHTFATEICISRGVPLETTSRMMGHSSLTTTQIYARITHNKVIDDTRKFAKIIGKKYSLVS